MKISSPPPIRKPLPLTPLVDIVFLLLIFFMLSSTFLKLGHQDVGVAQQANASSAARPPGLLIRVGPNAKISINGKSVPLDGLTSRLNSYADEGVTAARLSPGPAASVQDLVTALSAVRASRLTAVSVE